MRRLYTNGHIHPMTDESSVYTCMTVENGIICAVGDEPVDSYDEVTDLDGCHVYPALWDSHLHLLYSIVLAAGSFQVCETGTEGVKPDCLAGVKERLEKRCRENPKQKIITGNGYIASAIKEKRLPTRQELDEWSGGRAVIIYNIDGHSSAMSTKLMEMLKLPTEGHCGIFSGEEHEFMQGRVTNLIASCVSPALLARGLAEFQNNCAEYGIAGVCAMDGNEDVKNDILTSLLSFIAARMDISVRLFPQYMSLERAEKLSGKMGRKRAGGCGAWELDGSVGSKSAAFFEGYADGTEAKLYYSDEKIFSKVREALEKGMQLSAHAIGSRAIDQITRAYESCRELLPAEGALCRIDHFEFPNRESVERVKKLPLALTVQPGFSWVDKRYLKSYEQFLPESAVNAQIPLKELDKAGVCLCGSSDSPVQSVSPFQQMLGMVEFYLPEQSLSNYEALRTYCVNPARMLGEQHSRGSLEKGKRADFFVCRRDLLSCTAAELAEAKAEYTVIGGERYVNKKGTAEELLKMLLRRPKDI